MKGREERERDGALKDRRTGRERDELTQTYRERETVESGEGERETRLHSFTVRERENGRHGEREMRSWANREREREVNQS